MLPENKSSYDTRTEKKKDSRLVRCSLVRCDNPVIIGDSLNFLNELSN